ncbi:site-specific recombinase XerD [Aquabacterium commune]|uniref:Site-specific recombinase XerD n=1 Tax=Aquabacterium commune TaxID=70586 RepID=A0A4R6RPN7_9BURK|nr:tyrosine-type recombinase/integrase [Aquabacterium commune]TDP88077.1 site-specific recombinase XerD [Aquabacterium commune]
MAKMPFTAARVAAFKCPEGKQQAFLWDEVTPGLGLRATPHGKPAYVFQGLYCGRDVRITIGSPAAWSIKDAQAKARELQRLIDEGKDPRSLKRQAVAAQKEQEAEKVAQAVTVGDVWPEYLEEGKPKRRDAWKPRYLEDLRRMAAPGGEPKKRGTGKTRPGPLWPLLSLRLVDITEDTLKAWQDSEARNSKHQAARALMMFRGFLRWCATRPKYRALVDVDAGRAPALLQDLPSMKRRTDCLEAAQVAGWWTGVEQLSNRTASVYLRALLLTGARREEMAGLKWQDVDFQWRKLTIADKVEATRTIPLTPYLAQLLGTLPRHSEWVFASTRTLKTDTANIKRRERDNTKAGKAAPVGAVATVGASGRMSDPRNSHTKALQGTGIDGLTIHGLRRSFSLLGEAAGAPAGAIAQVMGHKPSATAEGYRPRSVDALRPFLAQIEAHILALAGVQFDEKTEPGRLRVISAP